MALLQIEEAHPSSPLTGCALWRLGFRPFYWMAACLALVAIPVWLLQYQGILSPWAGLSGLEWHVHELIFGYAVAVIAGFLLTAAQNWTGQPMPTGRSLMALAALWLAGRVLLPFAPLILSAPVDLAFLPLLAWTLHQRLRLTANRRNDFAPRLLVGMALLNLGFYLGHAGWWPVSPLLPLIATLYLIVTLEVIIAGRIVPMFTRNALPGVRQYRIDWIERIIAPLTALILLTDLSPLQGRGLAALNFALAVLHLVRWTGWAPFATWRKPLLWILHLSYLWMALGIALAGFAVLNTVSWVAVFHLLGIGATGGLTLGMLTRTALGHTGRLLKAATTETLAYSAIALAALLRIAPVLFPLPGSMDGWLWAAAGCWCAAFILYLSKYSAILFRARVDGKPG